MKDELYIDDKSASRGLDFATTMLVYSACLWFIKAVWYTF